MFSNVCYDISVQHRYIIYNTKTNYQIDRTAYYVMQFEELQ